jgi:hypothetical protein
MPVSVTNWDTIVHMSTRIVLSCGGTVTLYDAAETIQHISTAGRPSSHMRAIQF